MRRRVVHIRERLHQHRGTRLAVGVLFLSLGLVLAGPAAPGTTPTKPYTANICASPGPCIPPVVSPVLAAGASASVALTIANQSSQQSMGSANVTPPAGLQVTAVSPLPSGSSFGAGEIRLRNLGIAPGASATFVIVVTVPCQTSESAWAITAKQSNDYNGPPGNNFTLVAPSSLTTSVLGSCKLVFGNQPADAQVGRKITSVDYDPAAAPVTVEVHDGNDALVPTATGTVLLTPSSNLGAFSGASASLAGGVATFSSLQSSGAGVYTLVAFGTGYASSDPSSSFEIGSKLVFLTQPQDAEVGETITTADFGTVPPADYVKVAVVAPSDPGPVYTPIASAVGSATLTASSNPGSFSGTTAAFVSGVATFSTFSGSATGTYTVTASSSGSTSSPASGPFAITDFGTNCPAGETTCTGSAQSDDHKTAASVTSTTQSGFPTSTTLAMTMLATGPPVGVCPGFQVLPGSEGVHVDVRPLTDMTEITIRLDKSIVNAKPDNGAGSFDWCLGGKIVTENPATTPFTTKDGTPATYDPGTDLFWGILPNCSQSPTEPCEKSTTKNRSGDIITVALVPYPWDPIGYSG